jgi:hypothetical protein
MQGITIYASLSEFLTPIMSPRDREDEDTACDLARSLSLNEMEDTLIEVWDDGSSRLIAQFENGKYYPESRELEIAGERERRRMLGIDREEGLE